MKEIIHYDIQYEGFITKNSWRLISDKKKVRSEPYRPSQISVVIVVIGLLYPSDFLMQKEELNYSTSKILFKCEIYAVINDSSQCLIALETCGFYPSVMLYFLLPFSLDILLGFFL